ncbi:MAG: hypothetical protein D6753_05015 [Planctomycetota bacterium]|nr:MAG: hypothetical protein D6753_05015 [Planctomycetota bacterium]
MAIQDQTLQKAPSAEFAANASGPLARLTVLNPDGSTGRHWLIRAPKVTLGSAANCSIRCDLPGIAPCHALIVLGARQSFIRALAPSMAHEGLPTYELLLNQQRVQFEIAGHRFELRRFQSAAADKPHRPTPTSKLRFTLERALRIDDSPGSNDSQVSGDEGDPRRTERDALLAADTTADDAPASVDPSGSEPAGVPSAQAAPDRFSADDIVQRVQAVIDPLEQTLQRLIQPIANSATDKQPPPEQNDARFEQWIEQHQAEHKEMQRSVAKQIAALDVLSERMSDMQQQLATIERIIDREQASEASGRTELIEQTGRLTEEVKQEMRESLLAVQRALVDIAERQDRTVEWQSTVDQRLEDLQATARALSQRLTEREADAVPRPPWSESPLAPQETDSAYSQHDAFERADSDGTESAPFQDSAPTDQISVGSTSNAQGVPPEEVDKPQYETTGSATAAEPETFFIGGQPADTVTAEPSSASGWEVQSGPTSTVGVEGLANEALAHEAEPEESDLQTGTLGVPVDSPGEDAAQSLDAAGTDHARDETVAPSADVAPDFTGSSPDGSESSEPADSQLGYDSDEATGSAELPEWWKDEAEVADRPEDGLQDYAPEVDADVGQDDGSELKVPDTESTDAWRSEPTDGIDTEASSDAAHMGEPSQEAQEEDEDSVEAYMRSLLARLNGEVADEGEPSKPVHEPQSSAQSPRGSDGGASVYSSSDGDSKPKYSAQIYGNAVEAEETAPDASITDSGLEGEPGQWDAGEAAAEDDPPSPSEQRLERLMEMPVRKRRVVAPESLEAMRTLANSSARTAIQKSTRKRVIGGFLAKVTVASIGASVAGFMMYMDRFETTMGTIAIIAGGIIALVWCVDALLALRPLINSELFLEPQERPTPPRTSPATDNDPVVATDASPGSDDLSGEKRPTESNANGDISPPSPGNGEATLVDRRRLVDDRD